MAGRPKVHEGTEKWKQRAQQFQPGSFQMKRKAALTSADSVKEECDMKANSMSGTSWCRQIVRMLSCVKVVPIAFFGMALTASLGASNALGQATYYNTYANDGVVALQTFYDSSTGQYVSPAGWWHTANGMTTLSDYEAILGDSAYYSVLSNTFTNAQTGSGGHANFENDFTDDMGWWALAWVDAYDVTADSTYLSMAETLFNAISAQWDTTVCGGGLWWKISIKPNEFKGGIQDELFMTLAAKLANRTTGSTSANYRNWADTEWNWFSASGIINSSNLVNNNLNRSNPSACYNDGTTPVWTYNQGVILGGLVELAQADNNPALVAQAQSIANAVLSSYGSSTPLVDANGILQEYTALNGNGDVPQFKGIFMRNLATLNTAARVPAYQAFLDNNVSSIWNNDRTSTNEFGYYWAGPVDSEDGTRQSSADDALVGAIRVQGRNAVGAISTTGFGSMQAYAGDGSGNIYQNWQSRGKGGLIAPANWQSNWSEFNMNGVQATGTVAVSADGIGRQWFFIPTTTDVYYKAEANTGGGWGSVTDMGSSSNGLSTIRALYSSNGGQYVFGQKSGTVYYASKANPNSSWSSFSALSGLTESAYNVAVNAQTAYVEVFGVDSSGELWTDTQTGLSSWSGWTDSGLTGETVQTYVTAVANSQGGMQVFAIDTSNTAVWTNHQSSPGGSWSGWKSLGNAASAIQPGFICAMNANGALQFYGVGSDGNMYTAYQTSQTSNTWSGWTKIAAPAGQPLYSYLVDNNSGDGRILVMAVSKTSPHDIYGTWESYPNDYTTYNSWQSWGGAGLRFYGNQL